MRGKLFDPDEAVSAALSAFWANGYQNISMPELLEAMNIGRGSFYDTFGSKRAVFLMSLSKYVYELGSVLRPGIPEALNRKAAVALLLDRILKIAKSNSQKWRGCLLGNSARDVDWKDKEMQNEIKAGLLVLSGIFEQALQLPGSDETKYTSSEKKSKAMFLTASIQGLLVMAQSGLSDEEIKESCEVMLEIIT
jgi:TetR/AcrR family transcriptional regulator, transcriptional repressor for nem operon